MDHRQIDPPEHDRRLTSIYLMIDRTQGPVAVVSIVGPYHSGKSFMLNQLVRALADYTVAGEPNPGYVRMPAYTYAYV